MNTEMQVKKGFPATADAYLPKLQANSLIQGQNSPHPSSEEDAKASRPAVAEHSTAMLPEGFWEDVQLPPKDVPKDCFPINHCTGLGQAAWFLASDLLPPPQSLLYLDCWKQSSQPEGARELSG